MNGYPARSLSLICALLVVLVVPRAATDAGAQDLYVWPLAESRCLTSTFGDYRPGHFHSGIDLSTGGREGLPVRVADSGHVWRVRTACNGYGKALYVRLADGRLAVYAHLSRFAPGISEAVARAQVAAGQYEVEIWPQAADIPVERGEIVGYTGQTGAGPPHLHFELRDDREHPINPLTHGVSVEDAIPPTAVRLIVRPLDLESLVNGERRDLEINLVWDPASACYTSSQKPVCSGRVGILLEGYDHTNPCRRNLSVGAATLALDGVPIFRTCFQEFGYEETGRIDTYYDREQRRSREREFHRLYRAKGNCLSFGDPYREWAGVITYGGPNRNNVSAGSHEVEVLLEDASGNVSRARLDLIVDERPVVRHMETVLTEGGVEVLIEAHDSDDPIEIVRVAAEVYPSGKRVTRNAESLANDRYRVLLPGVDRAEGVSIACTAVDRWGNASVPEYRSLGVPGTGTKGGHIRVESALAPSLDHLRLSIESPVVLQDKPKVWSPNMDWGLPPGKVEQVDARRYRAIVPLTREFNGPVHLQVAARDLDGNVLEGHAGVEVWSLSPESGGRIESPARGFSARVEPGQVFEDLWLTVTGDGTWAGMDEVRPVGPVFAMEPMDAVFDGRVTVAMVYGGEVRGSGGIGICSPQGDSDWEWVGGEVDGQTLRVSVPYLTQFCLGLDETPPRVRVVKPKDGSRLSGSDAVFRGSASDLGSGLDCSSVGMELDGRSLIVEFDPELDLLASVFAESVVSGQHTLVVRAEDRAGNVSEARSTFWVD